MPPVKFSPSVQSHSQTLHRICGMLPEDCMFSVNFAFVYNTLQTVPVAEIPTYLLCTCTQSHLLSAKPLPGREVTFI